MHNPNPFDFVPFSDEPILRTRQEFDELGGRWTGYLEIKLAALTPVHVVGSLSQDSHQGNSKMVRQDGKACIPAATIRGCLRAFIEALTSGWVSQATPSYPAKPKDRHIGFSTFEPYQNDEERKNRLSPPAVNPEFKPARRGDGKLDVASYLFGIVVEAPKGAVNKEATFTRKSRVWVEDALIPEKHLSGGRYWVPDVGGKAFMGGAKPRASNWWYLKPDEIWIRSVGNLEFAEFVGSEYWGRKFYFHQNSNKCVQYYDAEDGQWDYPDGAEARKVWLECMAPGKFTDTFRVYVDRLPTPLVRLLVLALSPGPNMRQKLGYGKAYGYGSVQFSIVGAKMRNEEVGSRIPGPLVDEKPMIDGWIADGFDQDRLAEANVANLIDWDGLHQLARILGLLGSENLLFTYPPYAPKSFKQPLKFSDVQDNAPSDIRIRDGMKVGPVDAEDIADALFELKKPIHFRRYQQNARGWSIIERRTP